MRKLDFIIQTILFGLTLAVAAACVVINKEFMLFGGVTMFLIGAWQLLSGAATVLNTNHTIPFRKNGIRAYWLAVLIYFVVLAALAFVKQEAFLLIWFFVAWIIAIYYYVFTIKLTFWKPDERKTFMDVVN